MCDILPPAINDTTLSSDLSRVTASRTPKLRISPGGTPRIVIPGETAVPMPLYHPPNCRLPNSTTFIATRPEHYPPLHTRKACISTRRPANSPIIEIFPTNTASPWIAQRTTRIHLGAFHSSRSLPSPIGDSPHFDNPRNSLSHLDPLAQPLGAGQANASIRRNRLDCILSDHLALI
jgi:hypothetical protein